MASRQSRRAPTRGPRPWHRVVAALVLAASLVAVVAILRDVGTGDRTSWAKHVAGALAVLWLPGGISALVVARRPAERVWEWWAWTGPAALVWLGVEHWLDWFAFYNPSHGRGRVTTETDARVQGGFVIGFGVLLFALWFAVVRSLRRERASTLAHARANRGSPGPDRD